MDCTVQYIEEHKPMVYTHTISADRVSMRATLRNFAATGTFTTEQNENLHLFGTHLWSLDSLHQMKKPTQLFREAIETSKRVFFVSTDRYMEFSYYKDIHISNCKHNKDSIKPP